MSVRKILIAAACATLVATLVGVRAEIPEAVPELPVLSAASRAGEGLAYAALPPATPSAKTVDGAIADWIGEATRLGGTSVYSKGEYVYQDYYYDDYGADDGADAVRVGITDPLHASEPRTYRSEATAQGLFAELGVEGNETLFPEERYGDLSYPTGVPKHSADIEEVRVAADAQSVFVLVRTTVMTDASPTAALLLFDVADGGLGSVGFNAGVSSAAADIAVFATRTGAAGLAGASAAGDASGYANAIEVSVPRPAVTRADGTVRLAVALGLANAGGTGFADAAVGDAPANVYNVAFRFDEPVRIWMEKSQALELLLGRLDGFLASVSLAKLDAGANESFVVRPGYYEREFVSTWPGIPNEGSEQGIFQMYGLYVPTAYRPGTGAPLTIWLHWRGGRAHSAATLTPRVYRQLGEDRGNLVIGPSARGTSTWYLGRGHVDVLEAWADASSSFSVDADRTYVSGYSMGGYGSYLFGLMYPDRLAGAFPIVGPTLCGLWAYPAPPQATGTSECAPNNLKTWTFPVLENAVNLPYVIFEGSNDELVPVTGSYAVGNRLIELGYRYRFYDFLGYDHYGSAIIDEWVAGGRYLDQFRRTRDPAQVVYKRVPALEHAVEQTQAPAGANLDFTFDGAYWIDGITLRAGEASDDPIVFGRIDARTAGWGGHVHQPVPEAGLVEPGHSTPFLMTGLRWVDNGWVSPSNRFSADLVNVGTVTLDGTRMGLDFSSGVSALLATDGPSTVSLAGGWSAAPVVGGDPAVTSGYAGGVLSITLPASGTYALSITPA